MQEVAVEPEFPETRGAVLRFLKDPSKLASAEQVAWHIGWRIDRS